MYTLPLPSLLLFPPETENRLEIQTRKCIRLKPHLALPYLTLHDGIPLARARGVSCRRCIHPILRFPIHFHFHTIPYHACYLPELLSVETHSRTHAHADPNMI